jgi:hypothetical protein
MNNNNDNKEGIKNLVLLTERVRGFFVDGI